MNPEIEVSITRTFTAQHALPRVGVTEPHAHAYTIECGYRAPVEPALGCTRPMQALARELEGVLARLEGRDLNALLPVTPTAEMLACWILAQLPDCWQWASVRAYDGFMCKVERRAVAPFMERLRAAAPARAPS